MSLISELYLTYLYLVPDKNTTKNMSYSYLSFIDTDLFYADILTLVLLDNSLYVKEIQEIGIT